MAQNNTLQRKRGMQGEISSQSGQRTAVRTALSKRSAVFPAAATTRSHHCLAQRGLFSDSAADWQRRGVNTAVWEPLWSALGKGLSPGKTSSRFFKEPARATRIPKPRQQWVARPGVGEGGAEKWLLLGSPPLSRASPGWQHLQKTRPILWVLPWRKHNRSPPLPLLPLFCSPNILSLLKLVVKERIHSFCRPARLQEKAGSAAGVQHGIMLFFKTPPALPPSF